MAHGLRGFGLSLAVSKAGTPLQKCIVEQTCLVHGSQKQEQGNITKEKGSGTRENSQGRASRTYRSVLY